MSKLDKDVIISHLESELIKAENENAQLRDIIKKLEVEIKNLEVSLKKIFDASKPDKNFENINEVNNFNDIINFASMFAKEFANVRSD